MKGSIRALLGALLGLLVAPALAVAKPASTINVRIEGPARTLVASTNVRVPASGWVTKGGTPKGACSAHSAAGALTRATHGHWRAKYYPGQLGGVFITSIVGVAPKSINDYWTIFVNNQTSNAGICLIKPHRGEQVLLAITDGTQVPLVLRAPAQAHVGDTLTVTAGYLNTHGKFAPAADVNIKGAGVNGTTDKQGHLAIHIGHTGTLVLSATGKGYVRAAPARIKELA